MPQLACNGYPCYLYHHKLAPEGKVFNSAEETKNLGRGWVDTPANFPKPSPVVTWLESELKPFLERWKWLITFIGTLIAFALFLFKR